MDEKRQKGWFYPNEPGVKHDNSQCQTCIFRSGDLSQKYPDPSNIYCDYLIIKGRMRECPSSPICSKYVKGKRLRRRSGFNPHCEVGFSDINGEPPFARLKRFTE